MIEHEDETNNAGQDWARERLRNFLDDHRSLPIYRFALIAGVSRITISSFLSGKEVMRITLAKIAKAMGISPEKLKQPISEQEYKKLQEESLNASN
ncbi:unknown [Lactobacillus phage Lc-Nu]|jgi:plasmid maintenance system antidote protein VapI|uniref:HTH cro/C1-type domain-containing protein n=1 Tax=Lactobacillus phage Lc-Nu TaxID=146269 RepID=A8YQM3_9CAUD|nr:XRE family transcriptional regulator [Lactobacillus phage Lc-Nu]AAR04660.1 unknown [Lactobacillus phage Lc-Nu]DAL97595.1 MAG TPA: SOS-response transcriptional repressor [Caudoviricetes sp.]